MKRCTLRLTSCACLLLSVPATCWSATKTILASKDNTIYQSAVNNSAGGAAGIFVGSNASASPRRGLIAFDVVANLPAGVFITGAQLSMHLGNAPNNNAQNIELHRLTTQWGEGTAGSSTPAVSGAGNGFAAGAGDATWTTPTFGAGAWTGAGAAGDFIAAASATTSVTGPVETGFNWNSAGLLADVRGWHNGSLSNFGWLLLNGGEGTGQSVKAFYSRSATINASSTALDPSFRPQLVVDYVPEPATAVLLLLAGPLVFVLRRR